MKKRSLAAKFIVLGACVLLSAAPVYAKGKSSVRFIMHFVDPASSPYVEGGKKIAELVKEKTDGQITIDVLSGGELGGEWDTLEMAVEGKLDIATCANSVSRSAMSLLWPFGGSVTDSQRVRLVSAATVSPTAKAPRTTATPSVPAI